MINWEEDGEDVVEKKMKIVDGSGMDDEEKCQELHPCRARGHACGEASHLEGLCQGLDYQWSVWSTYSPMFTIGLENGKENEK